METVEKKGPDIDRIRSIYDEHEVRAATYQGRDLTNAERLNLGLDALVEVCRNDGRSIADFERASEAMQEQINKGETLGVAVSAGVESFGQEQ